MVKSTPTVTPTVTPAVAPAAAIDEAEFPEASIADKAKELIDHALKLFDPTGHTETAAFRLKAAQNACSKHAKSINLHLGKYNAANGDKDKTDKATASIEKFMARLDEEITERSAMLRDKFKVKGFVEPASATPEIVLPPPFIPSVSCPLVIIPVNPMESMYALVEETCAKHADKTAAYIETAIVERINTHAVHIVGERTILFALPDLATQNEVGGGTAFRYSSFKASSPEGRTAWAQLWGTISLPQLDKDIEPGTVWLRHRYHRQANQAVFQPPMTHDRLPIETGSFNLYSGPGISLAEALAAGGRADSPIVDDWLRHCRDMFPANGERQLEAYHAWVAQILQHPGRKEPVAPVFTGLPGSGKTTAIMMPAAIIGMRYVSIPQKVDDLTDKFTLAKGKLLTFADELAYAGDQKTTNLLKRMVSDTSSSGRELYQSQGTFANYCRLACAGNCDTIIKSEAGARRWIVVNTRGGRRDLSRFYTPEALNNLAAYYYTRSAHIDLSFLESEANSHGILAGMSEGTGLQQFALYLLAEKMAIFGHERHGAELHNIYTDWYHGHQRFAKSKAVINRELSKYIPYELGGSKNARTIILPKHEVACEHFATVCARVPLQHFESFIDGAVAPAATAPAVPEATNSQVNAQLISLMKMMADKAPVPVPEVTNSQVNAQLISLVKMMTDKAPVPAPVPAPVAPVPVPAPVAPPPVRKFGVGQANTAAFVHDGDGIAELLASAC